MHSWTRASQVCTFDQLLWLFTHCSGSLSSKWTQNQNTFLTQMFRTYSTSTQHFLLKPLPDAQAGQDLLLSRKGRSLQTNLELFGFFFVVMLKEKARQDLRRKLSGTSASSCSHTHAESRKRPDVQRCLQNRCLRSAEPFTEKLTVRKAWVCQRDCWRWPQHLVHAHTDTLPFPQESLKPIRNSTDFSPAATAHNAPGSEGHRQHLQS